MILSKAMRQAWRDPEFRAAMAAARKMRTGR